MRTEAQEAGRCETYQTRRQRERQIQIQQHHPPPLAQATASDNRPGKNVNHVIPVKLATRNSVSFCLQIERIRVIISKINSQSSK
jgi:hypothetical protein